MTKATFIAAAFALACSAPALANDSSSGKHGAAGGTASPSAGATQCDSLTGTKKADCMRQAQQGQQSDSATGATRGSASGSTAGSRAQPTESAPRSESSGSTKR